MKVFTHVVRTKALMAVLLLLSAACRHSEAATPNQGNSSKMLNLAIVGFNYTDNDINEFSVDLVGGGNIFISSPEGGGGGSVCCLPYAKGTPAWKTEVRWQVGACHYNTRYDSEGQKFTDLYYYYRTVNVYVNPKIPANPRFVEVHFYPKQRVEVALTETLSSPRIVLAKDRPNNSPFKHCKGDKRPN